MKITLPLYYKERKGTSLGEIISEGNISCERGVSIY